MSESSDNLTPSELKELVSNAELNFLPEKSREKYLKANELFNDWRLSKGAKSYSVQRLLFYHISWNCLKKGIEKGLPDGWPCEWNNDKIPFAYNFYLLNPNRLVNVAHRGIRHMEARSCLQFVEYNPVVLARGCNVTYLFFTFSDVLEYCCLPVLSFYRRRVVLITPLCTLPEQVAHVMLHAMGLVHHRRKPFPAEKAMKLLQCKN